MNLHSVFTYYFALLLSIVFSTGTGPGTVIASNQSAEQSQLISALDSTAAAYVADSTIAGAAVAVLYQGEYLLLEGYGLADLELNVPTFSDGIYQIGSVTKQFTAAAILQLVERGLVDLDADITQYLPDYNSRGHQVTIRQLLHHTSGIRDFTTMSLQNIVGENVPRDTLLSFVENEPFRFAPGTAMSYSNTNYFILGLVIEQASGKSYESFLVENLFGPAGMLNSHYCNEQSITERRIKGYRLNNENEFLNKPHLRHIFTYATGGLCSTVPDLVAWNKALHGGSILSDSLYQVMITPGQLSDGSTLRYAMGLATYEKDGISIIRHGGSIPGFISESRFYPEQDLIIVVLQNTNSSASPRRLADSLAFLVLEPEAKLIESRFKGDLKTLIGRYVGPSGWGVVNDLHIDVDHGNLVVTNVRTEVVDTLKQISDLKWKQGNDQYTFIRIGNQIVELRRD